MIRKTKRFLSLLLTAAMMMSMLPSVALADEGSGGSTFNVGSLTYEVLTEHSSGNNGTVALIGYDGSKPEGELTVSESVYHEGNYTVTEIGEGAFEFCWDITKVTIPSTVKTIGKEAFYSCEEIETLGLGTGVEVIGNGAFKDCTGLQGVALPNTVTTIGEEAFEYCTSLETVNIPASVGTIGDEAFSQCSSLTEFTVEEGNSNFSAADGVLYDKEQTVLVTFPGGKSFGGFAFPDTVKTIGSYAFAYMEKEDAEGNPITESLTIGDSVETIEVSAFEGCHRLSSIIIGKNVKSIGDKAFSGCDKLQSVTFADDCALETIGDETFHGCAFTEFNIPDTVITIGSNAFYDCDKLKGISISKNVTDLGELPFYKNNVLKDINVDNNNQYYSSKYGVLYNKSGDTLIRYPMGKDDTEFVIPSGVDTLADSAFYGCAELEKLTIPATVKTMGKSMFYWATRLEEIKFLGSLPTITSYGSMFGICNSLQFIYVPEGSLNEYKNAFEDAFKNALYDGSISTDIIKETIIPGTDVTTAQELADELEKSELQTIKVKSDIVLTEINNGRVDVGADHILIIEDDISVSTGNAYLSIPEGKTLTVQGPGTLEASGNSSHVSINIEGTLKLTGGCTLKTSEYGNIYVNKGEIQSINSNLSLENASEDSMPAVKLDDGGSLNMKGGTLDINTNSSGNGIEGSGSLDLDSCQVDINRASSATGITSEIKAKNCTFNIKVNGWGRGIAVYTNFNASDSTINIGKSDGIGIDFKKDSIGEFNNCTINVQNTGGIGIKLERNVQVVLDDKSTILVKNTGYSSGVTWNDNDSSSIEGGKFDLREGAKLVNSNGGFNGRFMDREIKLSSEYNEVYVVAEENLPSREKLSEGEYKWNDTDKLYKKGGLVDWGKVITEEFTDPNFLYEIRELLKKNETENEPIFENELKDIESLDVRGCGIKNLHGIECFVNLKKLDCVDNELTELDLSKLTNLTYLNCSLNELEELDLSNLANLEELYCSHNYIVEGGITLPDGLVLDEEVSQPQFSKGYGIIIGRVGVNSNNESSITGGDIEGKVSYDKLNNILILENAAINSNADEISEFGIYSKKDIVIKLVGDNTIGCYEMLDENNTFYSISIGIFAPGKNIKIKGNGNLTVYDYLMGIVGKNIDINSTGNITVMEQGGGMACCLKAEGGTLTINSGNLSLSSIVSNGLYGDNIVINGGTIIAQSQDDFAFNKAPKFGANYNHKVLARNGTDGIEEIQNPIGSTFTSAKYIRIEPKSGGGSSDSDSKDKGKDKNKDTKPSTPTTPVTPPTPDTPKTHAPSVQTTVMTAVAKTMPGGGAKSTITQTQMAETIAKAKESVKNIEDKPAIELRLETPKNLSALEIAIPAESVKDMASAGIENLTVISDIGSISFDRESIKTISGEAAGEISISMAIVKTDTLSDEIKQNIGDRPVYNFSVKSGDKNISKFTGNIKISIPYVPKEDEDINAIIVYYINDDGKLEVMTNCRYDAATGNVIFETDHFSSYAIGYNKIKYSDVAEDAWYAKSISFIAARGITAGTSENTFSPDRTLTRGQFVTMFMKAYGMVPKDKYDHNFKDAGNTYYTNYIGMAKDMGITKGIGDDKFAPDEAITRQDMSVMLYEALKAMNKLPNTYLPTGASDYKDTKDIAPYAIDALDYMIKSGVISGSGNNLSPKATATRAQIAQLLYNLMVK